PADRPVPPFAALRIVENLDVPASFRIYEAFAGGLPLAVERGVSVVVAPAFEQRCEHNDRARYQRLYAPEGNTFNAQISPERQQHASEDQHRRAQHDQLTASSTTAVPYATISLIVWPISEESKRIITMPFACMILAFLTIRSTAWRRASSRSCVYSVISPPTSDRRPAMMFPPSPRLRTTTPNTCPFTSLTR